MFEGIFWYGYAIGVVTGVTVYYLASISTMQELDKVTKERDKLKKQAASIRELCPDK